MPTERGRRPLELWPQALDCPQLAPAQASCRGRIRRFESYMPSHAVWSPRVKKRMSLKRRSTARSDAGSGISRSCMAATAPRSSTILFNARNASRSMLEPLIYSGRIHADDLLGMPDNACAYARALKPG